jgi:hypothetical protein
VLINHTGNTRTDLFIVLNTEKAVFLLLTELAAHNGNIRAEDMYMMLGLLIDLLLKLLDVCGGCIGGNIHIDNLILPV